MERPQDAASDAEAELRGLRSLIDVLPRGLLRTDPGGRLTYASAHWTLLTGQSAADAEDLGWTAALDPAGLPALLTQSDTPLTVEQMCIAVRTPGGIERTVAFDVTPTFEGAGHSGYGITFRDVADELSPARPSVEELFRTLAQFAPIGVFLTDERGYCTYTNERWVQLAGPSEQPLGFGWMRLIHPDDAERVIHAWKAKASSGQPFDDELRLRRSDGEVKWVRVRGAVMAREHDGLGYLGTVEDITELRAANEELQRLALHDPLTGLANRVLLSDRLTHALGAARREHHQVGVLVFDLDGFKSVNDTLGHGAGDRLLVHVANQLCAHSRPGDTVARFGGDEFTVVAPHLHDVAEGALIAERLLAALQEPLLIDGRRVSANASIGISVGGRQGEAPEELLRDADTAMYAAKARGKAQIAIYEQWMDRQPMATKLTALS